MPRNDDDDFTEEEASPQYVDWEPDADIVPKLIKLLRMRTVHEALLLLVAAATEIMKAARGNWDEEKVKSLTDL